MKQPIIPGIKNVVALLTGLLGFYGFLTAQNDYAASIQNRFNDYRQNTLQEKVFVHTDKNFYLAGEIVWFKIYYVEGTSHQPLSLSKVAYVEILDKDNKPVMQAKIALDKGTGNGSFYLPSSVNSGNYLLRAYTNWMKNFGPDYYFQKPVTIVNTLKPLNTAPVDTVVNYQVDFFPEGGNLVNNISSKVAFRVTNQYGVGQHITGLLVNENNDTLLSFEPLKFGMGHFTFTPSENHTYKAVITPVGKQSFTRSLPVAQKQGYVMQVSNENATTVTVTVTSNFTSAQQSIFLLAHTRQSVKVAEKKSLTNGSATFTIEKNKLGDGISQLTVFNSEQQPVCERLYFKYPEHILNITAASGSQKYSPRRRVQLNITTKTTSAVPANMSVAVYHIDSLQRADKNSLPAYLWLTSDLKGAIESPGYYFSEKSSEVDAAIDNLMLVHGWRRFNWHEVLTAGKATFEYVPEFDGHIITGRIINTTIEKPFPEVKTHLSVPGTQLQFYTSTSKADGKISFDVRDYYGQNEIILQTENSRDSSYRIEVTNPFSEKYTPVELPSLQLPETAKNSLAGHNIGMQVQNTYSGEKLSRFNVPDIDTLPFYGKPYNRYVLDDYVRFTTMEEVLREYVPDVAVRRYGGQYHLLVLNWEQRQYYSSDPLILLDGVFVNNQKIIEYDPLKVKKLEVVANKYIIGEYTYDGVVSFTTYLGNFEAVQLDPKTVKLDYDGLQLKREFYSPVYETEQQVAGRLPDFRNLLFWSPDIQTDQTGNAKVGFYTSDIKGNYIAILQGMDEQGNAGSYFFTFEVTGK